MEDKKIKKSVREGYARIAKGGFSNSCCGSADLSEDISKKIGYSDKELTSVPKGAVSLGCGNPIAMASLREGETVLDLGSGAGFDCFLAAQKVGKGGKVIGVDMTPEMIEKARENAKRGKYRNVEFRLAEIEGLPVADNSVDAVISNCVINLSPDKKRVFKEAFRVLKPRGRLMVSDIVLLKELPDSIKKSVEAYIGCISGAIRKDEYIDAIRAAGFKEVEIIGETTFPIEWVTDDPFVKSTIGDLDITPESLKKIVGSVVSIKVKGIRSA